jgi:hypothetical protein
LLVRAVLQADEPGSPAAARRHGLPTNHRVKPGWKIAGPAGKRRIVPDEEERKTMRLIVEWHDAGLAFSDISKVLMKQRVFWKKPSKNGSTLEFWDRQRCRRAYLEMVRMVASNGQCGA